MGKIWILVITGLFVLQGCAAFDKHHGINWNSANPNTACPALAASQKDSMGRFKIEDGQTQKCQILPFVSNMACQGLKDSDGTDVVFCQNGEGKKVVFFFTEKGVLKRHEIY